MSSGPRVTRALSWSSSLLAMALRVLRHNFDVQLWRSEIMAEEEREEEAENSDRKCSALKRFRNRFQFSSCIQNLKEKKKEKKRSHD